jgi:hypothetical protein
MNVLDMTLRQLLLQIPLHPIKFLGLILVIDQVLSVACMNAGWTKAGTFFKQISVFLVSVLSGIGSNIKSSITKKEINP